VEGDGISDSNFFKSSDCILDTGISGSPWKNGMMEQWNIEYGKSKTGDRLILFFDHCHPYKNRSHSAGFISIYIGRFQKKLSQKSISALGNSMVWILPGAFLILSAKPVDAYFLWERLVAAIISVLQFCKAAVSRCRRKTMSRQL